MLQRVVEEYAPLLVTARLEAEERRNNIRLREEQDAAYRAALEADQVLFYLQLRLVAPTQVSMLIQYINHLSILNFFVSSICYHLSAIG